MYAQSAYAYHKAAPREIRVQVSPRDRCIDQSVN